MKRTAPQTRQSKHARANAEAPVSGQQPEVLGTESPMTVERLEFLSKRFVELMTKAGNMPFASNERAEFKAQLKFVEQELYGIGVHRVHAVRCTDTFLAGAFLDKKEAEKLAEEVNKMPEHKALVWTSYFAARSNRDIADLKAPKITVPRANIMVSLVKPTGSRGFEVVHSYINTIDIPEADLIACLEKHKAGRNFVYFVIHGRTCYDATEVGNDIVRFENIVKAILEAYQ